MNYAADIKTLKAKLKRLEALGPGAAVAASATAAHIRRLERAMPMTEFYVRAKAEMKDPSGLWFPLPDLDGAVRAKNAAEAKQIFRKRNTTKTCRVKITLVKAT